VEECGFTISVVKVLSLETCLGIHMCAVLPFGNVLQSVVVVGRTKWVTWHEYLFSAKVRCASTNCLLSWTSFVRSFESGSKCTKPWFYIIVSIRAKRNSGYLLLVWYILVCFDNTYVFVPSIKSSLMFHKIQDFCDFPISEMNVQYAQESPSKRDTNY